MTLASDTSAPDTAAPDTSAPDTAPAPSSTAAGAEMTPQQYGVGARFTLSVYDSEYVRIILDALAEADRSGLTIETNDISTFVGGTEQRVLEFLSAVIAAAAASGAHLSAAILLSRGCPGELACALPAGVPALGAAPVALPRTGVRARAHWSLYPLLDGGSTGDHMSPIYTAIEEAKAAGVYSGSDHFATRLDGDLASVLETAANGWIGVGGVVQHVTTHLTVSLNSPTQIAD
ncbi:YkoF family thiamine/hydroxymethylpyrimidine-binding protein [Leucobacter sp. PH1c]|uniref:YkoF family thiamine/hydroxymethylpyrimidine-binding protein n=1 Tax=Leucobacter sp. PH1c TaxID=1397278 RepID=UPI000469E83D|nr:YkoF family thiamine/hydroxymethylpyrimidine-binding protein [Leucobacter sp. PH1c]